MSQLIDTLDEILNKTQRLVEICEILGEERELLEMENHQLRNQLEDVDLKNKALESKLEALKISKKLESDQSLSPDLKQKINEYIREIDQCILMLKKH